MIKGDLAAVAVTITFGALLGKTSHHQLLVISFIEVVLYSVNRAIGTKFLHVMDAGSSIYVHTFGAFFGLGVSRILYTPKIVAHDKETSRYTSDLFATLGKLSVIQKGYTSTTESWVDLINCSQFKFVTIVGGARNISENKSD